MCCARRRGPGGPRLLKVHFISLFLKLGGPGSIDGMFHIIIAFADSFLHVIYSTADINLMQN